MQVPKAQSPVWNLEIRYFAVVEPSWGIKKIDPCGRSPNTESASLNSFRT